ncbi:MAG: S8 family peptidase [Bacteroidota bacterium]
MKTLSLLFALFPILLFCQGEAIRAEARIDQVESTYGLSGEGVLTVMMDRGIDYRHPDFIDEAGNTRILYIYDLYDPSGASDPDNPFGVGTIYDSTEINAALQAGGTPITNDIFGHGTATTGIMAGNGSGATNPDQFKGVAPDAKIISIIVAKDFVPPFGGNPGQSGEFDPTVLPTAFAFAQEKIEELDRPSVTLLNIGSIGDPTDGSIALCETIEDFVDAGHPFFCGVGDDGGANNHSIKQLVASTTTEFEIQKAEAGNLRFTAWYYESDRVQLSVVRPDGSTEGPFNPPSGPLDVFSTFLNGLSIFHRGADTDFANSNSDLRQILIDISGQTGTYTVQLAATQVDSPDGKINGMLNPALYINSNQFLNNDNPGGNINSYSSCPATLSPTDYVADNTWVDINGNNRARVGEGSPGEIWIGSSVGPTMDGRLGVDISAPGEVAYAAYSPNSYYSSFTFNVLDGSDNNYGIQTAVSAAAPTLAGVVALMLEIDPSLTPSEIRTILQENAREDSFTGTTPNSTWGHGKLDAFAAVSEVWETVDTEELSITPPTSIYPNPFQNELRVIAPGEYTLPYRIVSALGQNVQEGQLQTNTPLSLAFLRPGIYTLLLEQNGGWQAHKVIKQ